MDDVAFWCKLNKLESKIDLGFGLEFTAPSREGMLVGGWDGCFNERFWELVEVHMTFVASRVDEGAYEYFSIVVDWNGNHKFRAVIIISDLGNGCWLVQFKDCVVQFVVCICGFTVWVHGRGLAVAVIFSLAFKKVKFIAALVIIIIADGFTLLANMVFVAVVFVIMVVLIVFISGASVVTMLILGSIVAAILVPSTSTVLIPVIMVVASKSVVVVVEILSAIETVIAAIAVEVVVGVPGIPIFVTTVRVLTSAGVALIVP